MASKFPAVDSARYPVGTANIPNIAPDDDVVDPPSNSLWEMGATEAEVTAATGGALGDLSEPNYIDGQTVELDIDTDTQATGAVGVPAGIAIPIPSGYPVIPDSNTDTIAMELEVTLPELTGTNGDIASLTANVTFTNFMQTYIGIVVGLDTATGDWTVGIGLAAPFVTLGASGTFRIGIDLNRTTNEATVRAGGSSSTTATGTTPADFETMVFQTSQSNNNARPQDAGKVIRMQAIQSSADFTLAHNVGAVQIADAFIARP